MGEAGPLGSPGHTWREAETAKGCAEPKPHICTEEGPAGHQELRRRPQYQARGQAGREGTLRPASPRQPRLPLTRCPRMRGCVPVAWPPASLQWTRPRSAVSGGQAGSVASIMPSSSAPLPSPHPLGQGGEVGRPRASHRSPGCAEPHLAPRAPPCAPSWCLRPCHSQDPLPEHQEAPPHRPNAGQSFR